MKKKSNLRSSFSEMNPLDRINYDNFNELIQRGFNDEEIANEFSVNPKFIKRLKNESRDSY